MVSLLRRLGMLTGVHRRTLSSAWSLLKSGDLRSIARRSVRRIAALPATLGLNRRIDHAEWRRRHVDLTDEDKAWILSHPSVTSFSVTIGGSTGADATKASLESQLHTGWSTEPDARRWSIELEAGVVLHEAALWTLARAIDNPDSHGTPPRLVYSDYDHFDRTGGYDDPAFLPDWNPELFAGLERISALVARHPDADSERIWDLDGTAVAHVAHLLASRAEPPWPAPPVMAHPTPTGPPTRVSILIPTRDQGRLLETCLRSIRERSTHPNVELVVVDHETTERRARRLIDGLADDPDSVVVSFTGPFNFAAMCNRGVASSSGEVVVLLNNDTEVVADDWLDEFVGQLARPEVGVVGALLLFGDGTIQHAGVHPGVGGLMGHGHKHRPGDDPGYHGRLTVAHEVAAVTGACLGTTRALWDRLGGLDEEHLAVAYNDIDLCLRARAAGLRVLLAPHAVLHHHESVSCGYDDDPTRRARLAAEVATMEERWGDSLYADPAYSPNLSLHGDGFSPATAPRVVPPWRT